MRVYTADTPEEILDEGHPGTHAPIIDRTVWSRVQALLGECVYKADELTYAGELIRCGHCGYPITGESVVKKQRSKEYIYDCCSKYSREGCPRIRLTEAKLDEQIMSLFARIKQPEPVRDWFQKMLRLWISDQQQESRSTADDIQRELRGLRDQQDRLLNLRLMDEIETDTFARKNTELRDRIAALTLQLESSHRRRDERADMAQRVFELSQSLTERWVASQYADKRQILEMICLTFTLDGAALVPEMRKPFDILIEGPSFDESRGDRI